MSPQNSDNLFDSGDLDSPGGGFDGGFESPDHGGMALDENQLSRPAAPVRPQEFSIYSVMLILSLVALTAAAIMFFLESGKY